MAPQLAFDLKEPWLPAEFDYRRLSEPERKVYNAIYYHQGAAAAIKIEALAEEAFYFRPKSWRERTVRDLIKALTENHKIAIASSCREPYGAYLITDPDELLQYTNNLTARAMSMLRRAASLKKISLPVYLGQLRAELDQQAKEDR